MLSKIFHHTDIPKEYHSNFIHLYFDIAWFGVLSGSAVSFLNIYATRLGATGFQIGLISAMSAVVNLLLAIPAGRWIERRHTGRAVFWSSVLYRIGYALWIPLPWLFGAQGQIWALIILTFLMAVPLTPLGVGFNALFAEAVPSEYRAHVAGFRNVTFAVTFMLTSLVSGYLLDRIPFPSGYQVVFLIGTIGAAMSSLHIFFIKPLQTDENPLPFAPQTAAVKQTKSPISIISALRLDIWSTPFRNILLALFAFHLTHFLTTPLYPLFNVHVLKLNDNNIGIGTAFYYLAVLMGSTQFRQIERRMGHKNVTGWGVVGMALYPFLLALSHQVWQYYMISFIGGLTWALVGGAYANYMLEHIPANDRPSHLAWYNIILNIAILASSLIAPLIADQVGLVSALMLFAALRIFAGLAILRWG